MTRFRQGWVNRMAAWLVLAALLAALLAAAHALVVAPVIGLYRLQAQELADKRGLLRRYQALAALNPPAPPSPERNGDEPAPAGPVLLPGASDAAAAAALELAVKALLDGAHAAAASTETLPAQTTGDFRQIGIRIVFSARLDRLAGFLRAVKQERPLLIIDNLMIEAPPGEASHQPDLSVSLDISGFTDAAHTSSPTARP